MLRVAMITDHSEHGDGLDGGVQAVTKYLIEAFTRRNDVELHIVSFKYDVFQGRSSDANGYHRHVLPGGRFGTLTGFRQDQRTIDTMLAAIQPDIVHGQGAGHNGIMAVRSRFPSVITIHGIMAEEAKHRAGTGRRIQHWLLSRLSEYYCISHGRHTILISPYVADYFRNRLTGQHYSIPNPIPNSFFSVSRKEIANRILFAGRLHRLKGVLDLIQAVSTVAKSLDVELHLAGSLNDEEYVRQLRDKAMQLGIAGRTHFKGLLGEQALRISLGEAAVLVLPSYQETAPMVIVEAMAAGVPVIASDVGGTRYLVRDGETGFLIPPGNTELLAERLTTVLSDASLRKRFGVLAKSLARTDYRAERVVERTIEVYRKILDRPSE